MTRTHHQTARTAGVKPSPSATRATQVLGFLATGRDHSFTVSELARALDLNRATCQAVLMALDDAAFVRRDSRTKAYSLGPALVSLGEAALAGIPVIDEARAEIDRLAAATGVEGAAAVALRDDLLIVALAGTGRRFPIRVGHTIPLCPPFGAAFVAWADDDAVESWLDRAGPMADEQRRHYVASLDAVRARGYSVTLEIRNPERLAVALGKLRSAAYRSSAGMAEHHLINQLLQEEYVIPEDDPPGAHRVEQVAAPVFDDRGEVAMILGLTGFGHDLTLEQLTGYVAPLLAASHRLTARLGGRRPVT